MIPRGFVWTVEPSTEVPALVWLRVTGRVGGEVVTNACAFSPGIASTCTAAAILLAAWGWARVDGPPVVVDDGDAWGVP